MLVCGLFLLPTAIALFARDALPWPQLLALAAALYLLGVYALLALRTFVSGSVGGIIRIIDRIAGGELLSSGGTHGGKGTQVAGQLWGSVLKMNGTLGDIVQQVRASAETIAAGARTIADGNAQLAQRTEEQAASLEETASGVEQLAASAQRNAEGCARANELAGISREVASQAAERMQQVASTMRGIDTSARRVAEILGTVQGIAFQTNILALNAAVEAARAGDQGRGFAVVAAEVRTLAQRSAAAAKEIKTLIVSSVDKVGAGERQAVHAGDSMGEVVRQALEMTALLAEISSATQEQNKGVAEVSQAVTQMDHVTQSNASLVEEAAAAAESLNRQAEMLVHAVSAFRIDAALPLVPDRPPLALAA